MAIYNKKSGKKTLHRYVNDVSLHRQVLHNQLLLNPPGRERSKGRRSQRCDVGSLPFFMHIILQFIQKKPKQICFGFFVSYAFAKAWNGSSPKLVGFQDYAKIFDNLKRKNSTFLTPLNCALKAFILALKDSAEALVLDQDQLLCLCKYSC